ncbi:DNA polymerase IV [Roseimaritima ulvae]|uniref:DNA polymerase IV n=1 Tax=Roseimaritima ulvae TaxID=980254 RepID=A0A5B9QT65_9BACT|nr:DNA polymerase IV [Roseimaritima ulvae]QEG40605.1 DNA polymerase IV [Roseimaritima ulvae]
MILHVDMDAFYASIEQRDRPELRGLPVVVGGSRDGRGVVAAASYEARRFGIHSAMPGKRAAQLCPDAVFVKTDMAKYAAVGRQVRAIFHAYTPLVQPLSLDEAFLDVSGSQALFGDAAAIGRQIQQQIADDLNLVASVGIAPLKFVAKIASDLQKPSGFVVVAADQVQPFLDPLPISRLWGVGRVGQQKLQTIGIQRIADLRVCSQIDLERRFGRWGTHLWKLANGIDERRVVPDHQAKQIGHERTFWEDLDDESMLRSAVSSLVEQVCLRLRHANHTASSVGLKYRRHDFRTFTRSRAIPATDSTQAILQHVLELLAEMRSREPAKVRLVGVSLSQFKPAGQPQQMSLFEDPAQTKQHNIDRVLDQLGSQIHRASSHQWKHRP